VPVLGTGLPRKQDQLLGAVPVGVDVGDQLQAGAREVAEPEVRHLDACALLSSERHAEPLEQLGRTAPCIVHFRSTKHLDPAQ
jgi:hypothetical protein